jgi:WD40 repeat protein
MRRFARVRFSLAQSLIVTLIVAVICSGAVTLQQLLADRFPPEVQDIQISPDGSRLGVALSGAGKFCCLVCDSTDGRCLRSFESDEGSPVSVAMARDLDAFAAIFDDGRLRIGRITSGATASVPASAELKHWFDKERTTNSHPISVGISGDGTICAVGYDKHVEVFDTATARRVSSFATSKNARFPFCPIRLSNDGRRLVVINPGYCTLEIWDTLEARRLAADSSGPDDVAWVGNGALASVFFINACAASASVRSMQKHESQANDSEPYQFVELNDETARARSWRCRFWPTLATSSDGKVLAVTLNFDGVIVLDAATLEMRYPVLEFPLLAGKSLAISDEGKKVAVGLSESGRFKGLHEPQIGLCVLDMPSGAVRKLWPHCDVRVRVAVVLAYLFVVLAAGIWLLRRAAERKSLRKATEPEPAAAMADSN